MRPRDKFALKLMSNLKSKLAYHEMLGMRRPKAGRLVCYWDGCIIRSSMIDIRENDGKVFISIREGNCYYGVYDSDEEFDSIVKINKRLRSSFQLLRTCAQRWKR